MSYHIEINEYQRRLIMKALTSTDVNQFSQAPGSGDAFDTEAKEFVCLVQMFGTLDLDAPRNWAEALFHVPNSHCQLVETGLPGWGDRTRTQESVRQPCN